jgi:hypothetical protein
MVTTTMVAVVTNQIGLQRSRLPQPRGESAKVVAIGHPRQAGEGCPAYRPSGLCRDASTGRSASRVSPSAGRRRCAR